MAASRAASEQRRLFLSTHCCYTLNSEPGAAPPDYAFVIAVRCGPRAAAAAPYSDRVRPATLPSPAKPASFHISSPTALPLRTVVSGRPAYSSGLALLVPGPGVDQSRLPACLAPPGQCCNYLASSSLGAGLRLARLAGRLNRAASIVSPADIFSPSFIILYTYSSSGIDWPC